MTEVSLRVSSVVSYKLSLLMLKSSGCVFVFLQGNKHGKYWQGQGKWRNFMFSIAEIGLVFL